MRFVKPTMSPFGFFEPADLPTSAEPVVFKRSDFTDSWICIPFFFPMKIKEFNPEQQEIRWVPGFAIRLEGNQFVAYSRICPRNGCILNYVPHPRHYNCGCGTASKPCCCAADCDNPVLICPCDGSAFDLANDARVICGPAPRPPSRFELDWAGDTFVIASLEPRIR